MEEILNYFTEKISIQLENEIKDKFDTLEEIRLRVERPIVLKFIVWILELQDKL